MWKLTPHTVCVKLALKIISVLTFNTIIVVYVYNAIFYLCVVKWFILLPQHVKLLLGKCFKKQNTPLMIHLMAHLFLITLKVYDKSMHYRPVTCTTHGDNRNSIDSKVHACLKTQTTNRDSEVHHNPFKFTIITISKHSKFFK